MNKTCWIILGVVAAAGAAYWYFKKPAVAAGVTTQPVLIPATTTPAITAPAPAAPLQGFGSFGRKGYSYGQRDGGYERIRG
jgi:hypothetical protein